MFFNITLTDNFPFEPPQCKFCTLDPSVRIHPNLYTSGKVCLSILGTWSGPGWAPSMSIKSVLFSIQSIMTFEAIKNEPGYENTSKEECKEFDDLIQFNTIKYSIFKMITNIPPEYKYFHSLIKEHFIKNKEYCNDFIKQKLEQNKNNNFTEKFSDRYYSKHQSIDYKNLESQFNTIVEEVSQ